jgi:hypothetical protein
MDQREYILRLMRQLQARLAREERRAEAALIDRVTTRLSRYPEVREGVEMLYRIPALADFAIRLMWFGKSADHIAVPTIAVTEDQVCQLAALCESVREDALRLYRATTGDVDLGEALIRIAPLFAQVGRMATSNGPFRGLDPRLVDDLARAGDLLKQAGEAERKREIANFGTALGRFCRYVVTRHFTHDTRAARMIGNAGFALQAAVETSGEDAFDSLRQTTHLLGNPETVLLESTGTDTQEPELRNS